MKKLSHISFLNVAVLALAVLAFWAIGSKTFAADFYIDNFTPAGCNASLMTGIYKTPSEFTWDLIWNHTIYIVSWDYTITSNIEMDECSVIVVDKNSTWAKFTFENGAYISSNTQSDIIIRGYDTNKRLTLINGDTSPVAIILQNVVWATVSYTSISGFTNTL